VVVVSACAREERRVRSLMGERKGKETYSTSLIPLLSFKSAPAQKAPSTSLARINALVTPPLPTSFPSESYSSRIDSTWERNSESNWVEMAFRAEGRDRERMRMSPLLGAGRVVSLMHGGEEVVVEYVLRRRCWRWGVKVNLKVRLEMGRGWARDIRGGIFEG